jgi:uncharacterized membrane protein YjjP (DUF1212 family)
VVTSTDTEQLPHWRDSSREAAQAAWLVTRFIAKGVWTIFMLLFWIGFVAGFINRPEERLGQVLPVAIAIAVVGLWSLRKVYPRWEIAIIAGAIAILVGGMVLVMYVPLG